MWPSRHTPPLDFQVHWIASTFHRNELTFAWVWPHRISKVAKMGGCVRVLSAAALVIAACMGISGCSQALLSNELHRQPTNSDIFSDLVSDTGAKRTAGVATDAVPKSASPGAEVYIGPGIAKAEGAEAHPQPGGNDRKLANEGVNLNFENAEIKTVARAILGDVLHLNYAIDPSVSGTITLSTRRPVARAHALSLLETALRGQGAVIVAQSGVYRIVPEKQAGGFGKTHIGRNAGADRYAVTALPLEHISAESLQKILDGFGAHAGSVQVDVERNLLIVQGTQAERQSVIDTALAFDVDWMRNQSVGIFPLRNASPDTIIGELNRVVDANSVHFQAVERMNAILAVSRSQESIRKISTWISRLDRASDAAARVRVYRLRYADAKRVAGVVREVFGAGSGQSLAGTPNQIAPGMGSMTGRAAGTSPPTASRDAPRPEARPNGEAREQPQFGEPSAPGADKIRVTVDSENNAVVVYSNQERAKLIEQAIHDLDRPTVQVSIEATIAEVTLNDNLRNGVQFYLANGKDRGSIANLTDGLPLQRVLPGLNLLLGPEASPKLVLDALREVTDVKIVSSPSLVVLNNEVASLQVGDQVPVTTRSAEGVLAPDSPVVNSIDFRDTGVILRVTPRVHADSMIGIDIEQEISSVKDGSAALTPTISQRRVQSKVSVADGQTLLIGGLISEQRTRSKSGIPGVTNIPVLGEILSGMHTDDSVRTELIIFIKPRLLRNMNDARRVAEDLRQRMTGFSRW